MLYSAASSASKILRRPGFKLSNSELLILVSILALAVGLRVLWMTLSDARPEADDPYFYDSMARSVAAGRGFMYPDESSTPTALFPPGYAGVLGAFYKVFGPGLWVAQTFNLMSAAATILIIYVVAKFTFEQPAAIFSALLFAVFPSQVIFPQLVMSETLFTLLLTLVIFLLFYVETRASPKHVSAFMAGTGALAGLAALVRGQALVLLVIVPIWWLLRHRTKDSIAPLLLFLLMMVVVVMPWTVRNWIVLGSPVLISTNLGWDATIGHNDGADGGWMYPGLFFLNTLELPLSEREVAGNTRGIRLAWDYARSHPVRELQLSVKKTIRLWNADADAVSWQELGTKPYLGETERKVLTHLSNSVYYLAVALAAVGLLSTRTKSVRFWQMGLLLIVGWTAMHFVIFAENRFHYPLIPMLAIAAGAGFSAILKLRLARAVS